jgi:hypothetical protein
MEARLKKLAVSPGLISYQFAYRFTPKSRHAVEVFNRSLMPGLGGLLPILCISFMLYVLACVTPALVLSTCSRAL